MDNQTTPFGMVIEDCTITACWDELLRVSDYDKKIVEKDEFNKNNIYKKRGIGTSPVKFGVGYDNNSENQGGTLSYVYVSIYILGCRKIHGMFQIILGFGYAVSNRILNSIPIITILTLDCRVAKEITYFPW